jgi:hypothetical protein
MAFLELRTRVSHGRVDVVKPRKDQSLFNTMYSLIIDYDKLPDKDVRNMQLAGESYTNCCQTCFSVDGYCRIPEVKCNIPPSILLPLSYSHLFSPPPKST